MTELAASPNINIMHFVDSLRRSTRFHLVHILIQTLIISTNPFRIITSRNHHSTNSWIAARQFYHHASNFFNIEKNVPNASSVRIDIFLPDDAPSIFKAIAGHDDDVVDSWLSQSNPDISEIDSNWETALHVAVRACNVNAVEKLLKWDTALIRVNRNGFTPIDFAFPDDNPFNVADTLSNGSVSRRVYRPGW